MPSMDIFGAQPFFISECLVSSDNSALLKKIFNFFSAFASLLFAWLVGEVFYFKLFISPWFVLMMMMMVVCVCVCVCVCTVHLWRVERLRTERLPAGSLYMNVYF